MDCGAEAELLKQIGALDIQILHLESHLLSLYTNHHHSNAHRTLAHHLGTSPTVCALNDPAHLSQQILGCICSIYSKFADMSGPLQVTAISLDAHTFKYAATMLQKLRSLVEALEHVDPAKMKREDKLAFWLNIHNALLMHGYLAYGTSSIFKAAYNVGGHCINAQLIQTCILGIRSRYSPPWIQTLLKKKKTSTKHVYCLDYPEPLVHFALSSGSSSDPPVRVYTPTTVFQDLKLARDHFIRASLHIHKESKLYLPKLVYHFGREMSMTMAELLETVCCCVAQPQQKAVRACIKGREDKCVSWIPMTSTFQFLIHNQHSYMLNSYIQT